MTRVYLGLGSNIRPEANVRLGVEELRKRFGAVDISPVYRAPAIGFDSDDFLNLVVAVDTELSAEAVLEEIEAIHDVAGRERDASNKWVARSLDIDLLLYGDLVSPERPLRVPRSDVLEYAFVLCPLAELAPDGVHPVTGRSFAEHWAAFGASGQPLTPVAMSFDGPRSEPSSVK